MRQIQVADLTASANEIDTRMGPIPGRSSDRIANELRWAATEIGRLSLVARTAANPTAWRVSAGGNSERHLFDNKHDAQLMYDELEKNGWLDVAITPLAAVHSTVVPAATDIDALTGTADDQGAFASHSGSSAETSVDRAAGLTDEQIEDLRSHVRGSEPSATGTYDYELGSGWRCFHCGEMFRTWGGASLHFGGPSDKRPSCLTATEPQPTLLTEACGDCQNTGWCHGQGWCQKTGTQLSGTEGK